MLEISQFKELHNDVKADVEDGGLDNTEIYSQLKDVQQGLKDNDALVVDKMTELLVSIINTENEENFKKALNAVEQFEFEEAEIIINEILLNIDV